MKHLIDAISHKGLVFTFDERGLNGMLSGRRTVAIYACGLGYGPESQTPDHAWGLEKIYLEAWLRWVGIKQSKASSSKTRSRLQALPFERTQRMRRPCWRKVSSRTWPRLPSWAETSEVRSARSDRPRTQQTSSGLQQIDQRASWSRQAPVRSIDQREGP
ncbi:hypothetical protein [Azorhizophilus paspali]|uniref:Uncharacterized protein n=1 Tax=Azorhizophilus paspali TaxID=69963 RepID=A0ABV6SFG0_AZOPA